MFFYFLNKIFNYINKTIEFVHIFYNIINFLLTNKVFYELI